MKINVAKRLNGTEEYYFSKKLREIAQLNASGKEIINLGIGNPDQGPPVDTIGATMDGLLEGIEAHGYQGYKGIPALREAMAGFYKNFYQVDLDPESEILPLMGSKEGIMHLCMTYLQEGDECLIPDPGYPTYRSAVSLSGATPVPYNLSEENDWYPDFKALAARDLSKVKLMWVNYPHMPTGTPASMELFERLIAFGKKHNILICHDNPYSCILNEEPLSILSVKGAMEVAVELNSLSKSFGMAGWRIGMLLGKADRINEVMRFKSNMDSGMFYPLQLGAIKALQANKYWFAEQNRNYRQRQQLVYDLLKALGCSFRLGQMGLFVWAKIPDVYPDGYALSDEVLKNANVFITPGGIFGEGGKSYVRVSICSSLETLEKAIARVKEMKPKK